MRRSRLDLEAENTRLREALLWLLDEPQWSRLSWTALQEEKRKWLARRLQHYFELIAEIRMTECFACRGVGFPWGVVNGEPEPEMCPTCKGQGRVPIDMPRPDLGAYL